MDPILTPEDSKRVADALIAAIEQARVIDALEKLRADYAKKAKKAESIVRYAHKALAKARAQLEAADEVVAAARRNSKT